MEIPDNMKKAGNLASLILFDESSYDICSAYRASQLIALIGMR